MLGSGVGTIWRCCLAKKVSSGDLLAGVCGLLLLLTPFTKLWATYDVQALGASESTGAALLDADAFPGLMAWLVILAALATVFLAILRVAQGTPNDPSLLYMASGGAMFAVLMLVLVMGPNELEISTFAEDLGGLDISVLVPDIEIGSERGIMLFSGPLLAAGVAFGGFVLKKPNIHPLGVQMPGRGLDA